MFGNVYCVTMTAGALYLDGLRRKLVFQSPDHTAALQADKSEQDYVEHKNAAQALRQSSGRNLAFDPLQGCIYKGCVHIRLILLGLASII